MPLWQERFVLAFGSAARCPLVFDCQCRDADGAPIGSI